MADSASRRRWFWLAQGVTVCRLLLAFLFVVLCPFASIWPLTASVYLSACVTDFFDGRLARAKNVTSKFGGAMDVFGDRYLTVISCMYVGFRGVSLIPLSIILARELYSVAMRMVQIDGKGIMMQNRAVGGIVHSIIAVGTLGYIAIPSAQPSPFFGWIFTVLAIAYLAYFPYTVYRSRQNILQSIRGDLE